MMEEGEKARILQAESAVNRRHDPMPLIAPFPSELANELETTLLASPDGHARVFIKGMAVFLRNRHDYHVVHTPVRKEAEN
jgi:hypothetical protein